ncbi:MAG: gephyrin-like molybdotransferase Glp [Anaerolineae bacterium]|jgi:molybdenum cofactor synthesis domain-containing protein|nr:molybdopterin molybdotransferase MoeA [Chloroflexota bacterium]
MTIFRTQSKYPMISLEEAQRLLEEYITPLPARRLALAEVPVGAVLAEPITSPDAVPGFDAATMDGYAVLAEDGASRRRLAGAQRAGSAGAAALESGQCVRIMTGAPLPQGADAVIPVEYTQEADGWVITELTPQPGLNVRPAGSDIAQGQLALPAGTRLGAAEIGVLATLGIARPRIYPQPRVTLLVTGDELAALDGPLAPGQIRDSNSYVLTAAIRNIGAPCERLSVVEDTHEALRAAILTAALRSDLIISTGGVSMGTHDLVKPVLEELGVVHFGRVAIKPGLPLTLATVLRVPFIGLPGNPVSTLVGFENFIRPAMRRMAHISARWRPQRTVKLAHAVRGDKRRLEFQRAIISQENGEWWARTTGSQASSRLLSLVGANALLRLPASDQEYPAGSEVIAILTDAPEQDTIA